MEFLWRDYDPKTMEYVEQWLDQAAIQATGLTYGFRAFHEYWTGEEDFQLGKNFWSKVVFEKEQPLAILSFCLQGGTAAIMELLVRPEKRGRGYGSQILRQLLENGQIVGVAAERWEAVIYPDNLSSLRAFENAGFRHYHTQQDENGISLHYAYKPIMKG